MAAIQDIDLAGFRSTELLEYIADTRDSSPPEGLE